MASENEPQEDTDLPWLQPAEEDESEGWLSTRTLVIGAVIFVVIFAGLLWVVYQAISNGSDVAHVASNTELPLIEAPEGPNKVPPEDPGGAEIPGRDKMVLEAADGNAIEPEAQLSEGAEEPIERGAPENGFTAVDESDEADAAAPIEEEPQAQDAEPATQPELKPEPQPAPAVVAETPAQDGRYLLQLGAFSSDGRARTGWSQIQDKHADIVGDLTIDTELATINGKTIYRLRGAAVQTREEADRRCAALKAAGQGCLVIER